jgi:hypothetical protein
MAKTIRSPLQRKIPTSAQPLHEIFLKRVIRIPAVEQYRAAALNDATADDRWVVEKFFSEGYHSGRFGDFLWSLDEPEEGCPWISHDIRVSPPILCAWNAAVVAFKEWIKEIIDGKWIAEGMYKESGIRSDIDPAVEFACIDRLLNVRNGNLIEIEAPDGRFTLPFDKKTVRWSAIKLRPAQPAGADELAGYPPNELAPAVESSQSPQPTLSLSSPETSSVSDSELSETGETREAVPAHSDLVAAIEQQLETKQPGKTENWGPFYREIRKACKVDETNPPRGYGDRTIWRAVKSLQASRKKNKQDKQDI